MKNTTKLLRSISIILLGICLFHPQTANAQKDVRPTAAVFNISTTKGVNQAANADVLGLLMTLRSKLFNDYSQYLPYRLAPEDEVLKLPGYNREKFVALKMIKKRKRTSPEGYIALWGFNASTNGQIQRNRIVRLFEVTDAYDGFCYLTLEFFGTGGEIDMPTVEAVPWGSEGEVALIQTGTHKVTMAPGVKAVVTLIIYDRKGKMAFHLRKSSLESANHAIYKFDKAFRKIAEKAAIEGKSYMATGLPSNNEEQPVAKEKEVAPKVEAPIEKETAKLVQVEQTMSTSESDAAINLAAAEQAQAEANLAAAEAAAALAKAKVAAARAQQAKAAAQIKAAKEAKAKEEAEKQAKLEEAEAHKKEESTVAEKPAPTAKPSINKTGFELKGHDGPVLALGFSDDGAVLASGGYDKKVKLWSMTTGELLFAMEGHKAVVNTVEFSDDGKLIASGGRDKLIIIWDVATGTALKTITDKDVVNDLEFSPDGVYLASATGDNKTAIWDVGMGTLFNTFKGHSGAVNSITYSPDGRFIASGSRDKKILIRNAMSGSISKTLKGHDRTIISLEYTKDGKSLVSNDGIDPIRVWNVANSIEVLKTYAEHERGPASSVTADGKLLIAAKDNSVKLCELNAKTVLKSVKVAQSFSHPTVFSRDESVLAIRRDNNLINVWFTDPVLK